ncbi:unnamed protein product [Medioppia subpectinata]|uniref:Metalloendopeptidase n=1 Tax=Medioppia subpectinata TaxID=1979941 RepID=A0A7R9KY17_9ACAR|nr:unnamed protein product [Medioppia subpectinata]CAG2110890.1 unnamed protein product [Medioppia subpectinata]
MSSSLRMATKEENRKWLNGRVPYVISDTFSANNKALILSAIENFKNNTCVTFERRTPQDVDYVLITGGQGCNSPVGRQGRAQNVTLGEGCLYLHTILHELMHSIGFLHEHQRYDRDDYIVIHWQNIRRGMEYEFNKIERSNSTDLELEYDYKSVMQYEGTAFSKNARPTMEAKQNATKLGSELGFSELDKIRINRFYGCFKNSTQNNQTVLTNDRNLNCSKLKWSSFDSNGAQNSLVIGGKDSFGNTFYVCRALINNRIIAGHMYDGMCYVLNRERELEIGQFQVLTHFTNAYKWQYVSPKRQYLPSNAIIGGKDEKLIDGNQTTYIGRCLLKYFNYTVTVIGALDYAKDSLDSEDYFNTTDFS